jgi:hypothetical protein
MKKVLMYGIVFIFSIAAFSQKTDYSIALIPDSLKLNANAVVRLSKIQITISSQKSMSTKTIKAISVLNELGMRSLDLSENCDNNSSINKIEATIYNATGKELNSYKRRDFKDQSATDEGTIFSDNRVLFLDYTPVNYPFTVVFESEIENKTTAFIPFWSPLEMYYVSVENASFTINFKPELGIKTKELNFSNNYKIERTETSSSISYSSKNLTAKNYESLSPRFDKIFPKVMFGLTLFSLEGVNGTANSWKEIGKWFYDEILTGTTELSNETKAKVKSLVGEEKDPIKKAKIIYKYVQDKTRYVSIQEGIGGWKPMLAKDVDKLGYGDCKALTNYTRSLLNEVGVVSYYSRLYGNASKMEIIPDIVSFQSNHVILAIPNDSNYIWLECTSQDDPFGYQAYFTDDRQALVIKPDGGEIVQTKIYIDKENTQNSKGSYSISEKGDFSGNVTIISEGTQYTQKARIEKYQPSDKEAFYKDYWDNINNLKINKITFNNDKEKIAFTENAELKAMGYGVVNGNSMMFAMNAFNQSITIPQRYRIRSNPLEIERGFLDTDEIEITLPENFTIDAKPNNYTIKDKFGEYKTELVVVSENKLRYKRSFLLNEGVYDKSEYENYRKFCEQIAKADNAKIVLIKKL